MISHKGNRATTKAGTSLKPGSCRITGDTTTVVLGWIGTAASRLSSFDGRQLVGRKSGQS